MIFLNVLLMLLGTYYIMLNKKLKNKKTQLEESIKLLQLQLDDYKIESNNYKKEITRVKKELLLVKRKLD